MKRSLLAGFVRGTRQVLAAQLVVAVLAVAIAGWTLAITGELIRERDRLRDRVIQLEQTLASRDIVVPSTADVVNPATPMENAYPPSIEGSAAPPDAADGFNPGQLIADLIAPAPPLRRIVLHVRNPDDRDEAEAIAAELRGVANVAVLINAMPARDARPSNYSYFDGRQSRTAAAVVQSFHDIARERGIAAWSAQLPGVALPAEGEFGADRLDIVLPPLPPPPPPPVATATPAP